MKASSIASVGTVFLLSAAVSGAAVIVDPALLSGPSSDLIDPIGAGAEDINSEAPGSTPQATIEARSDVFSLQSVAGFGTFTGTSTTVANYVNFTSTTLPDLAFTASATSNLTAGSGVSSAQVLLTSPGGSVFAARHASAGVLTMSIGFGTYDTAFTSNFAVSVAAFALTNIRGDTSVVVNFLAPNGTVLSSQSVTGAAETGSDGSGSRGVDFYFGWEAGSTYDTGIGSIQIIRTTTTNAVADSSAGIDDLVFGPAFAIPEPSAMILLGLSSLAGLTRRRR
jgi:hypothetical protein